MMSDDRNLYGALSSLICALCYVVGFGMIFFIIPDLNVEPTLRLQAIKQHSLLMQLWYFVIFIVFGASLLILSHQLCRLARKAGVLWNVSLFSGYLWACYVIASGLIAIVAIEYLVRTPADKVDQLWTTIYVLQAGLGEGVEWVGGIWMLLISLLLFRNDRLPLAMSLFGMVIAFSGLLTILPNCEIAGAIFGLTQIIWFCLVAYFFISGSFQIATALQ